MTQPQYPKGRRGPAAPRVITPDLVRSALLCIPPDVDRETWVRLGMACKSELDGTGFELWDEWSRSGTDYNQADARDTWRSIKAGGRVKIGTLFAIAKEHGFRFPEDDSAAPAPDPLALQRAAEAKQRQREAEEAKYRERADKAAQKAARMWEHASEQGSSAYLQRKGVQAHGVRFMRDGTLLVPMCNEAGELQNLQQIAPTKPTEEERAAGKQEKRYLYGGRKAGLWHMVGEPQGAALLVLAEGYATASTVHEVAGHPVAVGFDSGNLPEVAKSLRRLYPAARLLVAGDDDKATEARTGKNPGCIKASAAADAVGGLAFFPEGLPEGGSDFNDLAQHAGPGAVLALVERAAAELRGMPLPPGADVAPATEPDPEPESGPQEAARAPARGTGTPARESGASAPPEAAAAPFDRFMVNAEGVFFTETDDDGRGKVAWICSRLVVTARTRDADGDGWGYLLEFDDPAGRARTWAMPARMLAGDGAEYRATLLNMGLRIASGTKARNLLTQYLQTRQPDEIAQCTDRVGWHGRAFVLPRETIQRAPDEGEDAPERIVYQTDGTSENPFRSRGTLEGWRAKVAAPCVGNSRLAFALSCAFAGPLMRPGGLDSGGFHLRGDSSCGKTTALRVAASVYGTPGYIQRWRATDNALEAVAAQHCDGLLILDELAQVDPKTAGECAYMLANESSKARSTRTGQTRQRLTWRLLFLSSGEIGLAAHMAEGGKRARAGQELRMVDIPAEVAPGTVFNDTHGHEGGAAFALYLAKSTEAQHGHAGRAFLAWCVDHADTLRDRSREAVEALAGQWVPDAASGQVHRVGRRFALVAVAGELATEAGITGWPRGEATAAARACFDAWLMARAGGIGNAEEAQMLAQVRRWLQLNGAGRFTWWHRALDDRAPDKGLRAGLRRLVTPEGKPVHCDTDHQREYGETIRPDDAEETTVDYFVFPEVFDAEACEGFDKRAVLRLLKDAGHLVPDKGRPFDCKPRLPGLGLTRCYRIRASIFEGDGD